MTKGWSAGLSIRLTLQERSFFVIGPGNRQVGIVVRNSSGAFVGWSSSGKRLGDFELATAAESAVRAAMPTKRTKTR